jgi:hypothetical protein
MPNSILGETLFAGSTVRLFGRKFEGLTLNPEPADANTPLGAPATMRALQKQLQPLGDGADWKPGLARIYGFSYQGSYYKLAEPTVLLVYGEGEEVSPTLETDILGIIGVEFKAQTFTPKVRMWAQDRADYSVRIDITVGWLADVLLEPGMNDGTNMTSGQGPDGGGRPSLVGRAGMVGRAGLVGRGNSG